jgi:hypothetical protein
VSCKSGSAFPSAFEFAVWKQDRLPLVRVIDYAYQAPIDSILGGPLYASPEPEIKEEEPFYLPLVIKQEEESVVLTLVEESINLAYPQVPPFPHVEDYLWPDFSDDADAFFEQFEEPEELASYRSESPRLPPAPRFDTPVDQRRIEFFQGWEFEEFDFRYVPPPAWQEPLPASPRFPPVDLLDPGYHVPEEEQVHQDFRNFYPEPIRSPPPLEEPIDWTYVHRRLLEQEIFRSGFSTPLTSSFIRSSNDPYRALLPNAVQDIIREGINLGIEQQGDRRRRSDSRERNVSKRRRISSELPPSSSASSPSRSPSPPPIPRWHRGVPYRFGHQRPPLRRSEHLRKPARYRQ